MQVLYALEIANCLNISRAAQRLYISQSALSQQILRLERELGYPLFVRTVHGLQLTEAGQQFCRQAQPAADAWEQLCRGVLPAEKQNRRKMRVVTSPRVYSNGLFPHIMDFFDAHPELDLAFVAEAGYDYRAGLRSGRVDLALDRMLSADPGEEEADLYTCSLIRERQCVLMAPSDPRAGQPSLSLQDLQGCAMISGLEGSAEEKTLRETCRKFNISLNRVYRSDGITTVMELVRSGKSLGLGPESFASYYQVAAVPLEPATTVSLDFICLKSSLSRRDIQKCRDHLLSICRQRELPPEPGEGNTR